jgi:hypothetical protein
MPIDPGGFKNSRLTCDRYLKQRLKGEDQWLIPVKTAVLWQMHPDTCATPVERRKTAAFVERRT